jgi:hypothetical protein
MLKKEITIELETATVLLKPITARKYYNYYKRSLPISQDYGFEMTLIGSLRHDAPDFTMAHCYAALKTLFGESTTMFDTYKCSFGYTFLLEVLKDDNKSEYLLNFTDLKGSLTYIIKKVLPPGDLKKYDLNVYHEPFKNEFSRQEMRFFMNWFTFFLVGFMKTYRKNYCEEFFRYNESALEIYGYKDGKFLSEYYEECDHFRDRLIELEEQNITFNKVKPNTRRINT